MNTTMTLFLRSDPAMYTSPGRTYARVGVRDPARMYVCGRIFFLAHWPLYVRVHATCAPLLRHVRASRPEWQRYVRFDQVGPDCQALPCLRRCSWWVPAVRGANRFFARTHFLVCEDVAGGSQQSGGNVFFTKYDGPSGGSLLSGGGIIIFHVIRRQFLAAAVDLAISVSTYSPRPMEVVP